MNHEFDLFWKSYPKRVGKLAAERAYQKARRMASAAMILEGVERYRRTKPSWQEWAHPTSWLNQGRWLDEAPAPVLGYGEWHCPHTPQCNHPTPCTLKQRIAAERAAS